MRSGRENTVVVSEPRGTSHEASQHRHAEDDEIRDWATLGVGSILDVDSAEIRDALARRLSDPGADTSGEAMVGPARRNDPRCFEFIDRALAAEDVGNLVVEAAAELGDPRLLPALEALDRAGWAVEDPRGQWLAKAIERCLGGQR